VSRRRLCYKHHWNHCRLKKRLSNIDSLLLSKIKRKTGSYIDFRLFIYVIKPVLSHFLLQGNRIPDSLNYCIFVFSALPMAFITAVEAKLNSLLLDWFVKSNSSSWKETSGTTFILWPKCFSLLNQQSFYHRA
jgi:hypothetical protein